MKRFAYLAYQLALLVLAPLVLLFILRDAKRRHGGWRFIAQRCGFAYPGCEQSPLWFHAASLGEVNALQPLITLFQDRQANIPLLITTSTPSGAAAVANMPGVLHAYLPYDLPWAVQWFLHKYQPRRCVIVETELWPNLYTLARRAGCPPSIINGRLSAKTLRHRWVYPLLAHCLQQCSMIYTRSDKDKHRFFKLGADKSQVLTVGNIKLAGSVGSPTDYPHLLQRPYLLAASTHNNEEWQFCHALAATGKLLVIVPRHPERRDAILAQLRKLPLNIAVRSTGDKVSADTQIYLADTTGEMMAFIAHAELVFIGGSLIPHGGQNMLEAARLGKAIICGPHTDNFSDEVAALRDVKAIIEVEDADILRHRVNTLLKHPEQLDNMGQRGQELLGNNGGIARQYYKLLAAHWGLN